MAATPSSPPPASRPRLVEDKDLLRATLRRDPIATAYMLGDLADPYCNYTRWYGAGEGDTLEGVVLVYTALSAPVVITFGEPGPVEDVFATCHDAFPGRALVHLQPDHLQAIDQSFKCENLRPMLRMGLSSKAFAPAPEAAYDILQLGHRDTGEIIELFQFYPDNFFEPTQLGTGHYYGVRLDGRLVSVAGVHVFAPDERVACLGNIVTHPDYRGRGLSTACTSHLCAALIAEGVDVLALNVDRHNRSAVRVYEKLGFREHLTYLEGLMLRTL